MLEEFPRLKPLLDRPGGALSGGEQQLLAIARCLCGKPRLVLLDEPTEGIQPSIIDEIVETLQRLREKSGLTMILVEQNLDFIAALSNRILHHPKGRDHPGSAAGRSRRRQSRRRIHRNHHLSSIQRAVITGREAMAVRRPTLDQLRSVAEDLGMHMGEEELKSYDALMQANFAAYDIVDAMPDYVPAVTYPRTPGYRPEGEENKYNAWYVKTDDQGRRRAASSPARRSRSRTMSASPACR